MGRLNCICKSAHNKSWEIRLEEEGIKGEVGEKETGKYKVPMEGEWMY